MAPCIDRSTLLALRQHAADIVAKPIEELRLVKPPSAPTSPLNPDADAFFPDCASLYEANVSSEALYSEPYNWCEIAWMGFEAKSMECEDLRSRCWANVTSSLVTAKTSMDAHSVPPSVLAAATDAPGQFTDVPTRHVDPEPANLAVASEVDDVKMQPLQLQVPDDVPLVAKSVPSDAEVIVYTSSLTLRDVAAVSQQTSKNAMGKTTMASLPSELDAMEYDCVAQSVLEELFVAAPAHASRISFYNAARFAVAEFKQEDRIQTVTCHVANAGQLLQKVSNKNAVRSFFAKPFSHELQNTQWSWSH